MQETRTWAPCHSGRGKWQNSGKIHSTISYLQSRRASVPMWTVCVRPLGQNCSLHRTGRVGDGGTCAASWSGKLLLPQLLLHNLWVFFPPRTGSFDPSCIISNDYVFCGWSTLSFLTMISFLCEFLLIQTQCKPQNMRTVDKAGMRLQMLRTDF